MRPRFTKNVSYREETWDYASRSGVAAVIERGGEILLRHGVAFPLYVVVRPAVYSEPQKIYPDIWKGEEVPPFAPHDDEDEDGPRRYTLQWDEGGYYYVIEPVCIDPGETRKLTLQEIFDARREAHAKLVEWLEVVYQAGLALAEGRVEEERVDGSAQEAE